MNKNILYVKTGALGDVVRNQYLVDLLKKTNPNYKIFFFTSYDAFELVKNNKNIFKIIFSINEIKLINFDHIYSFEDDINIIKSLSQLNYNKLTGLFFSNRVVRYTPNASKWFDMGIYSKFGIKKADILKRSNRSTHAKIFSNILNLDFKNITPFFYGDIYKEKLMRDKLTGNFVIGINPFAGSRWPSKSIDYKRFYILVMYIKNYMMDININFKIILFSNNNNKECLLYKNNKSYIEIVDTKDSLFDLAALVKQCNLLISTDSLIMHLAISQNIPNVAFFSPTSASEIDSFGLCKKVKSTSLDYCNYKKYNDNSSITALRLFNAFKIMYKKFYIL